MGEEPHTEETEESSVTFTVDFRPGELLLLYQLLSTAEVYLEKEKLNTYSAISGGLSRKVLFAMLDEDFKDAVSEEINDLNLATDSGPISFQ